MLAAAARVQRGGALGVSVAIFTPGVRAASVAACGLAGLPLRIFVPGLVLGSAVFVATHFALGYLGGQALALIAPNTQMLAAAAIVGGLLLGLALWIVIRRRQRPTATGGEIAAEAFEAWSEATCPVCLVLGTRERLAVGHVHDH
jgi:LPXTG-motif cell wall-anchored protein